MIFLLVIWPISCLLYLVWVLLKCAITFFLIKYILIVIFEVSRLYTSGQFTHTKNLLVNLNFLETKLNGFEIIIKSDKTFFKLLRNYLIINTQFMSVISNNCTILTFVNIVSTSKKYLVDYLSLHLIKLRQHSYMIKLEVTIKNFLSNKVFQEKLNFLLSNACIFLKKFYMYYITKYHLVLNTITSTFFFYGMTQGKNWWENVFLLITFVSQQTLPKIYRYLCILSILILGYLTVKFTLPQSYICIKIDILKYFYNSLYLHTLFAYVAILCTLYSFCTIHFDYVLDLYYSVRFTLYMIWSLFFYTPEDLENLDKNDPDVKL